MTIKNLFTIFVMLLNSVYANNIHLLNKLYIGQYSLITELSSTGVKPFYIMENKAEVWKDILGYEGMYQVSNLGNIRSLDRIVLNGGKYPSLINGKNISLAGDGRGYLMFIICKNGTRKTIKVYWAVAKAFIPNPENKKEINHINGIKTDNRVENLEWVTHKENMQHAILTGLINNRGENHKSAKLKNVDVIKIRELLVNGLSQYKIAKMYNVHRSTIMHIKNRKYSWKI